jgi:hypothetical protein
VGSNSSKNRHIEVHVQLSNLGIYQLPIVNLSQGVALTSTVYGLVWVGVHSSGVCGVCLFGPEVNLAH